MPLSARDFPPLVRLPRPDAPVPGSLPQPVRITRAMARFTCIAGACEDTCCRDWAVPIDRADLQRLHGTMARTPAGHERFVRLVVLGSPSRHAPNASAQIALDRDGACPELDGDRRCRTHADLGESALPTACSIFPRTSLATPEGIEVSGSLACPESARLILLVDDSQVMTTAGSQALPRAYVGRGIGHADDPQLDDVRNPLWPRMFSTIRDTFMTLFSQRRLSLGARFAAAAQLADRLTVFHRADSERLEGSGALFAERRVRGELADALSAASLGTIQDDLDSLRLPATPATDFVASTLNQRRALPHPPRFGSLLARVTATYETGAQTRPLSAEALANAYLARREAMDRAFPVAANRIFTNLALHNLQRYPFTEHRTILEALGVMAVELGIQRFLVAGHPQVVEACERADAASEKQFEAGAVEAIQTYAKAVSHHAAFTTALTASLNAGRGTTLARLLLFARFL